MQTLNRKKADSAELEGNKDAQKFKGCGWAQRPPEFFWCRVLNNPVAMITPICLGFNGVWRSLSLFPTHGVWNTTPLDFSASEKHPAESSTSFPTNAQKLSSLDC